MAEPGAGVFGPHGSSQVPDAALEPWARSAARRVCLVGIDRPASHHDQANKTIPPVDSQTLSR